MNALLILSAPYLLIITQMVVWMPDVSSVRQTDRIHVLGRTAQVRALFDSCRASPKTVWEGLQEILLVYVKLVLAIII